jgi:lipopolysaccharide transport system permease protein
MINATSAAPFSSKSDFDLTIEPGRTEKNYWQDLWRYRELFIILAARDISVRYKQTAIGVAWALIQPFLTMIIMTVIFGRVAGLKSEGNAPYAIMVFAGMLPWLFFSSAVTNASQSMIGNANLITKVYFPRLIIPTSAIVTAAVDFLISFVILVAMMIWYRYVPSWSLLAIPGFMTLCFLASLGPGLFLTALNVKYRDFRYVIPFVMQTGLYISPVGFSSSVIHQKIGTTFFYLYYLNPVVGVIDGFRWCILGDSSAIFWPGFAISCSVIVLFLFLGVWYFRRTEKSFADII